jgi:hypothetical protein
MIKTITTTKKTTTMIMMIIIIIECTATLQLMQGNRVKIRQNLVPKSVETNRGSKVTILWKQQVQTDRTTPNNKSDIVIGDNEKGTCMLIDVEIPGDRNLIKKEAEKI